jgi:uncharacterized membrane protein
MDQQPSYIDLNQQLRVVSTGLWLTLIVLCVLWETVFAPLRPGGSWLLLKALPLVFAVRGLWCGNVYTYQWAAMLVLCYVLEGAVRVLSDLVPFSAGLAGLELIVAIVFFSVAILYVRPAKQALQAKKRREKTSL